jgi:hypothetical protein
MHSLDLKLYQLIEQEIGERLEKHAAEIVTGRATSYDDYRHRVGVIKGLREALSIAEEANREAIGLEDKER